MPKDHTPPVVKKQNRPKLFATEEAMCVRFTERARATGWEVYPECCGWDLLLVWTGDAPEITNGPAASHDPLKHSGKFSELHQKLTKNFVGTLEPGMQVGIQAKLMPNVKVLAQCIDHYARVSAPGPDFRAVLVPYTTDEFNHLTQALGLRVYVEDVNAYPITAPRVRWEHASRLTLPPVVPTWNGGGRSPRNLSAWRVSALRLCYQLRIRGKLTKTAFLAENVDVRAWVQNGGLRATKINKIWYYSILDATKLPDVGYEAERDAIGRQR